MATVNGRRSALARHQELKEERRRREEDTHKQLSDKLAEENRIRCVDQADKRALSNARAREINEVNEEISAEHARAARASAEAAVNTAQREEQAVADVVAKEKAERLRDEGFRKKAIEQSDELRSLRTTLSAVEANAQRDAQVCRYFPESYGPWTPPISSLLQ